MKCPICGSENVTRSHRKGMERISRFISLRTPYRCRECWSRFWVFENPFSNAAAKIWSIFILCLLILGLAWYFWPRKEETSWQAVQRNVGAVPQESERVKSSSDADLQPQTDEVKTEGSGQKSAEIPAPSISVPEEGKTETGDADRSGPPSADSGAISIPPTPADISKPAGESRDRKEFSALSEKSESPPGSGTAETETLHLPDIKPEKKEESDKASGPVMPESPKTETEASDAGTEAGEEHMREAPGESLLTGEKEPAQAMTAAETVPPASESVGAKTVSEPVSFRELRTVKTESEKDVFKVDVVTDGPVRQYSFFHLKSPPKLVVDLPGKWKHRGDALFKVKDSMVSRVRVGQHPDFIRVVLDLKIRHRVKPVFSDTEHGLSITLRRKGE